MPRSLLVLPVLVLPAAAFAQEGPSFDCNNAGTRTEFAICASPELSRLERQMVSSYNVLADVIGRSEARVLADDLLAQRQACEGDVSCIADQLVVSMQIFDQRAGRGGPAEAVVADTFAADTFATDAGVSAFDQAQLQELIRQAREARERQEIALAEPAAPAPAPAAPSVAAAAPAPAPAANPDIPLAAQAPLPAETAPATPDLSDALDDAELASSDGAAAPAAPTGDPDAQAAFDTPLSWAFMDLEREERATVQERLAGAGFYEGEAQGTWTNATLAALQRLAEEEGSGSFDLSTQSGAALLLDYVTSDAFTTAFGGAEEAAVTPSAAPAPTTPPTVVDTGDPLAGAEW